MVIPSIDEFVKVGGGVLLAVKSKVQIVVALRMTQPGKRKRGRSKNVEKDGTAGIRIDMGGGGGAGTSFGEGQDPAEEGHAPLGALGTKREGCRYRFIGYLSSYVQSCVVKSIHIFIV